MAYRVWVLYGPIKTPWWKNWHGCFRQKKEHEEKLAREEEDRQRNKEIWERVKRELQEDEQEAAKNWKDTEVCANASLVDYMGHIFQRQNEKQT